MNIVDFTKKYFIVGRFLLKSNKTCEAETWKLVTMLYLKSYSALKSYAHGKECKNRLKPCIFRYTSESH